MSNLSRKEFFIEKSLEASTARIDSLTEYEIGYYVRPIIKELKDDIATIKQDVDSGSLLLSLFLVAIIGVILHFGFKYSIQSLFPVAIGLYLLFVGLIAVSGFNEKLTTKLQDRRLSDLLEKLYEEYKNKPIFLFQYHSSILTYTKHCLKKKIDILHSSQSILTKLPDEISLEEIKSRYAELIDALDELSLLEQETEIVRDKYRDKISELNRSLQTLKEAKLAEATLIENKIVDEDTNISNIYNEYIERIEYYRSLILEN